MKHYGAVLTGDNNTVDGADSSILTVGTASSNNDAIIIHNEAPADATALKALTDFGLVIVPTSGVTVTSSQISHLLGADGREVALTDVGGGINSALTIPIVNAAGDAFVDSALTQTSTIDGAQTVTAGGNLVVGGNLQVDGTITTIESTTVDVADRYITLANTNLAGDKSDITGGIFVETDVVSGVATYFGIRVGADGAWEVTDAIGATTDDGTTGTWIDLGTAAGAITQITGANGITANVGSAAVTSGAVTLDVAITALPTGTSTVINSGGLSLDGTDGSQTLGIATGGITAGQLATGIGTARAGLGNGTTGQVLTTATNGGFIWATPAAGSVSKHANDYTVGSGAISIPATTHTLSTADTDYSVKVYEYATSAGQVTGSDVSSATHYNEVFPESVTIGRVTPGSGATVLGTVTITMPTTQNSNVFRVVIKS